MKVQSYVEYMIGGRFFGEEESKAIAERTDDEALANLPRMAYAYRFYDLRTLSGKLENGEPIEKSTRENVSGWHYPDAETFNADRIAALKGYHEILLSNMRCNDWPLVVRTRLGTWQPFNDGDVIVPMDAAEIAAKLNAAEANHA